MERSTGRNIYVSEWRSFQVYFEIPMKLHYSSNSTSALLVTFTLVVYKNQHHRGPYIEEKKSNSNYGQRLNVHEFIVGGPFAKKFSSPLIKRTMSTV